MSAVEEPIIEMTNDEYAAFLDLEVRRGVSMTLTEFVAAYTAGKLDDTNPEVGRLAALLAVGQNGN
jgi:hypothetical protein